MSSGRGHRWYRPACLVLSTLTFVVLVVALGFAVANRGTDLVVPAPGPGFLVVQVVSAVVWVVAALVMLRRPDLAWAPLAAVAGLSHGVAAAGFGWAIHAATPGQEIGGLSVATWLFMWTLPVEVPIVTWMLVTVPGGVFSRQRLDRVGAAAVALTGLGVALNVVAPLDVTDTDLAGAVNPLGGGTSVGLIAPLFLMLGSLLGDGVLVVRWRRARGSDRLALRPVVVLVLLVLAIVPLIAVGPPGVGVALAQIATVLAIMALIAAVYRHQLLGIERVLDRSIRYVLLGGLLAMLYAALVAAGEYLFGESLGLVAAVTVALVALPLHTRLARAVTTFVYGSGRDTQALVAAISERGQISGSPRELLVDALASLQAGLDLAWVTVTTSDGESREVESGQCPTGEDAADRFDLVHRGHSIGVLAVGPHRDGEPLDAVDRRLLAEVAPHLSMIYSSMLSATALARARDHLVRAREEERRRLRHDLHDGLGPVLTGAALSIDAASNSLTTDPDRAGELLAAVRAELTAALTDIRRIVENLRPPALDELGLAGALHQHSTRFPTLKVTFELDQQVRDLPAALEVCAYRIATEALTNVARHSDAGHALVEIRLNGTLEIEIRDDGSPSATTNWPTGVGIESMNDRAEELGGSLTAGPTPEGGRVLGRIPLPTP